MSYDDKALAQRPPGLAPPAPETWDSGRYCAPDPSMAPEDQLAWYKVFSHVLLLSSSESLRRRAAAAESGTAVTMRSRSDAATVTSPETA